MAAVFCTKAIVIRVRKPMAAGWLRGGGGGGDGARDGEPVRIRPFNCDLTSCLTILPVVGRMALGPERMRKVAHPDAAVPHPA